MSQHGVRVGQNIILEVLWQQDGLTPGEIAERLDFATPSVVNAATRMEAAGLVTRQRDSADARLVRLHLTPHAHSLQHTIERERSDLEQRATASLTEEERRHLHSALTKIIDVLSADERPPSAPAS